MRCEICGMKVEKGSDFERLGKLFCSEEHAKQFAERAQTTMEHHASATHHMEMEGGHC